MIADNKRRVMVTLSDELLERLEEYCNRIGITKSAYIAYTVATSLDTQQQLVGGISALMARSVTATTE